MHGPTKVCIFDGIMDAVLYIEILQKTLLPFIAETYPEGHRTMTQSIRLGWQQSFLLQITSIGGKQLLNPRILIQWKIYGTN